MAMVSGFLPSTSGLHFPNSFQQVPLLSLDVGIKKIPIGDASRGLCGGMVFTARDYFQAKKPVPADTTAPSKGPLYDYIVKRLFDSFDLPEGVARYYALMSPLMRDDESFLGRLLIGRHGRSWVMVKDEWPKIKADIDRGVPSPLALVQIKSADPHDLGVNHQVLAYGYEIDGKELTINVYDPNHEDDDDVTISFSTATPTRATQVRYSHRQGTGATGIWCFFRSAYKFSAPPSGALPSTSRATTTSSPPA